MSEIHHEILRMHEEFERIAREFFLGRSPFFVPRGVHCPPTDVFETKDEVRVRIEIPGVRNEEVGVTLEGDRLAVRGVRREPEPSGKVCYHRKEIPFGPFAVLVHLPGAADGDHAAAEVKNGFLTIRLKKKKP